VARLGSFSRLAGMLAVALAMASAVRAEPRVGAAPARPGALPAGVARGRALAVEHGALAELRGRRSSVVRGFPLGADATVDLELTRFEPFAPAARVEVVDDDGVRAVPLPDATYFAGVVQGDPGSRALLIAGADGMRASWSRTAPCTRSGRTAPAAIGPRCATPIPTSIRRRATSAPTTSIPTSSTRPR
jgi:hypothetical protein